MGGTTRQSNYELLRIFCIIGIVAMHTYGAIYGTSVGINRAIGVVINSICNACVSVFILISGYFGIKTNGKKLVIMEFTVLFYSMLDLGSLYVLGEVHWRAWIRALFPVLTKKYWFMTCYTLLVVLAPYIECLFEKMKKVYMKRLILVGLLFFYITPTILRVDILADSGKGIINICFLYILGRYWHYYGIPQKVQKNSGILCIGAIALSIVLNALTGKYLSGYGRLGCFTQDNSLVILCIAVTVFALFSKKAFYSKGINKLATYVLPIYLADTTIRRIIGLWWPFSIYYDKWYMAGMLLGYVCVVVMVACVIEIVRRLCFQRMGNRVADSMLKLAHKLFRTVNE